MTSITRVVGSTNPTSDTSVTFTITFSDAVTGVDASDFALTTTGYLSGATITSVGGTGTTYTVTVNGYANSGTLRLDLVDDDSIVDGAGTPLGGTGTGNGNFTGGQSYEISPPVGGMISEFRLSGPGGPTDEFIEIYNNSGYPLDLTGWTLTAGTTTVTLVGAISDRDHYLVVGRGYSLGNYALGDLTLPPGTDIPLTYSVTLKNASGGVVDVVNGGGALVPAGGATGALASSQYSFVRRAESGIPQDTDNDNADFNLVSTSVATTNSDTTGIATLDVNGRLGAPGPQSFVSLIPIQRNNRITVTQDSTVKTTGTAAQNSKYPLGLLSLRRTITNTYASTAKQMRFRISAITAGTSSTTPGAADIRALSSAGVVINGVTYQATPLETPSDESGNGGGLNSSWQMPLPNGGLPQNGSVKVEFLFGINKGGTYKVALDAELELALAPSPLSSSLDARIRSGAPGAWVGDGALDASGASENATQSVEAGQNGTFYVAVHRQSAPLGQSLHLLVPGYADFVTAGGTAHFFVGDTTQEITSDITSATGWATSLAPGQEAIVRVEVAVPAAAVAGSTQSLLIQAQDGSTTPATTIDAVTVSTVTLPSYQPDVTLERLSDEAESTDKVGAGVLNDDAQQTLSFVAVLGQTQTYLAHIKNTGAATATFHVSLGGPLSAGAQTPWQPAGWTAHALLDGTTTDISPQLQSAQGWPISLDAGAEAVVRLSLTAPSTTTEGVIPDGSFRLKAWNGALGDTVIGTLAVQSIAAIQWSRDGQTWHDTPLTAEQYEVIAFRAVPTNPSVSYDDLPDFKPEWTEQGATHWGEVVWIHFPTGGTTTIAAQCGNTKTVSVQVVEAPQ